MSVIDEVQAAMSEAMRARAPAKLSALRMLKAALMNRDVEKGRPLDDNEARQVVTSLVKQRKDSIDQFRQAGRQDLVDKETAELAVLEAYLPAAIDPACHARGRGHESSKAHQAERIVEQIPPLAGSFAA